jgi:hypothetical protein
MIPRYMLLMKAANDRRGDVVTKLELFDHHVRNKFFVLAVLEDRTKMVRLWRDVGLTCLQVADGDY